MYYALIILLSLGVVAIVLILEHRGDRKMLERDNDTLAEAAKKTQTK